jgi:hypothetical protein
LADKCTIDEFLADDDKYNKTDEPTADKVPWRIIRDKSCIQVMLPTIIDAESFPKMYEDDDSVSTFHHRDTQATLTSTAP